MIKDLVSIIIPVFNRAIVIKETLDSVLKQTYLNWECILVDDGSTDDTIKIINEYQDHRIKLVLRPLSKRKGANSCRNYGLEVSKGEFIQWFDSDDIMHSSKIEDKVSILKKSEYDFVVCEGIEFKNKTSNTFNKWDTITSNTPLISHIIGKVNFHTNGPMFRKEFLEKSNLFDESLQRKQEWEFYSRLLMKSENYYPLHKVLYYFRIHNNSINGVNSNLTLVSRVRANNLVFKNLKKNKKILKVEPFLRKHFFNKYIYNLKLTFESKKYAALVYILKGFFIIGSFNFYLEVFINFFKNPKVIFNLFENKY